MIRLSAMLIVGAAAACIAVPAAAQQKGRPSPQEVSTWTIGSATDKNRITIIYGRPYTKDPKDATKMRKIWGELVPYGKIWRTGANEATMFISQKPVDVGGKTIPGGVAFSVYTMPMANGDMKLIFNKELGQGGEQYDEKNDLARVDMKKSKSAKNVDQFTIFIEPNPSGGGTLKMMWDDTEYSVPVSMKK